MALILASGSNILSASAQTADFPVPTSVAAGTKLQIDGSSSMRAVNQNLKQQFKQKFPDADVTLPTQYQGSDDAITAVEAGKVGLASIGRPLTASEKAKGVKAKAIGRAKIAIIVKDDNPYKGNLTLEDFAKIYRGEVTDWSQLPSANGATGKITVVDRPNNSDTRRAFASYLLVFQNGPLKTGSNAQKLTQDTTQAVVDKLGKNGIGYAPVDQIKDIPGIRAVELQGTLPDNSKYPFSQPLSYAYKNGQVSTGAKAFLGYLNDPAGQAAIQSSIGASSAATVPNTTPSTTATTETTTTTTPAATGTTGSETGTVSTTTTTTASQSKGFPWWILLPLAIGGGLLWLLGRKKPTPDRPSAIVSPTPEQPPGLKPLYPPPMSRASRGDGLTSDLSGDISSSVSGFRPADDLQSGDLRSGDLSGTMPNRPNIDIPNVSNSNNGAIDAIQGKANDINLAGGAAIVGGAAAALGKGISDRMNQPANPPHIDLANPLEGLRDKSSTLFPDLDVKSPTDGSQNRLGEIGAGGAALAGGASQPIGDLFGHKQDAAAQIEPTSGDLFASDTTNRANDPTAHENAEISFDDLDDAPTPIDRNPLDIGADFLKDSAATAAAAGGAAISGGIALPSNAGNAIGNPFASNTGADEDLSEALWLEEPDSIDSDPFKSNLSGVPIGDIDTIEQHDLPNDLSTSASNASTATAAASPSTLEVGDPELDTFDRDLEAISLDGLDDDPFAGLSDLLGEETGDIEQDTSKSEAHDNMTTGFLDNTKNMGGAAIAGGAAAAAGAGAAFQSFFSGKEGSPAERSGDLSGNLFSEGHINLVSNSPAQAYAHWEIPLRVKRQLQAQGGQKLVLRLYDVTNVNVNAGLPTTFKEFECNEATWDLQLPNVPTERQYLTEIGYLTQDGRWLMLARSASTWIYADRG